MSKQPHIHFPSEQSLPLKLPRAGELNQWRSLLEYKGIIHPHPLLNAAFKTLCQYLSTQKMLGMSGHRRAAALALLIYEDRRQLSKYEDILELFREFSVIGAVPKSVCDTWFASRELKQSMAVTLKKDPLNLNKFITEDYYELESTKEEVEVKDSKTEMKIIGYATFTLEGGELLAQYYDEVHQAKLTLTGYSDSGKQTKYVSKTFHEMTSESFLKYIIEFCKREKKEERSYREAFLFNFNESHAELLVYVHEAKEQAFIYLSSTGIKNDVSTKEKMSKFFKPLNAETGATIYASAYSHQLDGHSCRVDAVALGSKLVRRDSKNGKYPLEGELLKELKSNVKRTEYDYSDTRLPLQFLMTVQRENFFDYYKISSEEIKKIPKLKEYTYRIFYKKDTTDEHIEDELLYNDIKSLKYADRIEIQFYLNEIRKNCNVILTSEIEQDFIKRAKLELKRQDYANTFVSRQGLDTFTRDFINQLLKNYHSHSLSAG